MFIIKSESFNFNCFYFFTGLYPFKNDFATNDFATNN